MRIGSGPLGSRRMPCLGNNLFWTDADIEQMRRAMEIFRRPPAQDHATENEL